MSGKIRVVAFDYPPLDGGIARLCAELARGLQGAGIDIEVVTAKRRSRNLTLISSPPKE